MDHDFLKSNPAFQASRRQFLNRSAAGLGGIALGSLVGRQLGAENSGLVMPSHEAKAAKDLPVPVRRPSLLDLFDHKPHLDKGTERRCRTLCSMASVSPA